MTNFSPGRFVPGERAIGTYWIGGWVGPKAGLDAVRCPYWESNYGRSARSPSLYRLSYPDSVLPEVFNFYPLV
jgi:hypothetical protein